MKRARDGQRTSGLLHYLYGPGKKDEHTNQHMVAAWADGVPDPGRDKGTSIPYLAALLDAPVLGLESTPPAKYVYHLPVRLAPEDRTLTDAEWKEIAGELMHAVGIAEKGDPMGARWVAIRHADDHIHIVATLARQDGLKVPLSFDKRKMQEKAKELEIRFGLRRLNRGDKTAKQWPGQAEIEKAQRKGRAEPPRMTLQTKVREVAGLATSDADFFGRIERAGLRLNKRTAPDGNITGYSVALPGDRTGGGRAIWFSGTRLAPDLSLPRVRERWTGVPAVAQAVQAPNKAAAWQLAAEHVHQAAAILGRAGNEAGAGEVMALADLLTVAAAQAPQEVRDELREAARAFERSGRAPTSRRTTSQAYGHLRTAAQMLAMTTALAAGGGEAGAALALLAAVALAITAAMRFHQAAQHRAQEQAAAAAGAHLRAATEVAFGARGRGATWRHTEPGIDRQALTETYAPIVRAALPELAETALGEAAWPALAATLHQAENAGYDPGQVLAEVAQVRGFGDADSVSEVLVWRLQKRLDADVRNGTAPTPAPAPRVEGGRVLAWRISHRDFRNEADVTVDDASGSGILPDGMSPEMFARQKLQEFAAKSTTPTRYSISVHEQGPDGRHTRVAYLPEGSVTPTPSAADTGAAHTPDNGGTGEGEKTPTSPTTPPPVLTRTGAMENMPLGDGPHAPTLGATVRSAVPGYASQVLADPAAKALADQLTAAARAGHAPADVLAEVVAVRDLDDADSVAQVLTWRMQGRLRRTGPAAPLPRTDRSRTSTSTGPQQTPGERSAADRAAQDAARRNQPRGPRR
ncbi:relaxase/mobilization nuclease domain-containing protein [Streptomyces sp. HUAS TT7]|uniref:relaxase/mobilization nuclease domain-containing protein n=1 Tax=Streptomyces sp. HUAS TT7 TaxID=3447507 RepID=UPI003F65DD49